MICSNKMIDFYADYNSLQQFTIYVTIIYLRGIQG